MSARKRMTLLIVLPLVVAVCLVERACADTYLEQTSDRGQDIKATYFGTHFHRLVLSPGEHGRPTKWPSADLGSIRLWDSGTLWSEITPQPGQWSFNRMDSYVANARLHGSSVLYTLGGTPRWASARPDERCPYGVGCAAEAVRSAHWEEYVRQIAHRYCGRVGAYEIWNEPNFSDIPRDRNAPGFYTGSVAVMVDMARIARKVLDEEDPSAILLTPGFVNGPDRLDLFLSSGGKQYVQAIAYHFYSANADQFIQQIAAVRKVMDRNGVGQLPLWNTETGIEAYPPDPILPKGTQRDTREQAAAKLAQFLVLGAALGLERFYQYAWDNAKSGMIGNDGEELPNAEVMRKVSEWLVGARLGVCRKSIGSVTVCEGTRASETFRIVWSKRESSYTLHIPNAWQLSATELAVGEPSAVIASKGDVKLRVGQVPLLVRMVPIS